MGRTAVAPTFAVNHAISKDGGDMALSPVLFVFGSLPEFRSLRDFGTLAVWEAHFNTTGT